MSVESKGLATWIEGLNRDYKRLEETAVKKSNELAVLRARVEVVTVAAEWISNADEREAFHRKFIATAEAEVETTAKDLADLRNERKELLGHIKLIDRAYQSGAYNNAP
ncbi:hypothetical protein BSK66_25610 [Paenibacillus odorifer]|uniref:hypothetical protein n=1 Tax=Paenibacillus TaxID=44249 RepID=UPI0003E2628D|nr:MULTISPECIES: hypothetical protein [Paenibacillus]ETT46293.1 hypothetical protein C171_28597 [Paenibacillus sp. FSL H8-237]OME50219.1 hypothetical protein BSK66_25610 [Paenibacillus odorifer]